MKIKVNQLNKTKMHFGVSDRVYKFDCNYGGILDGEWVGVNLEQQGVSSFGCSSLINKKAEMVDWGDWSEADNGV